NPYLSAILKKAAEFCSAAFLRYSSGYFKRDLKAFGLARIARIYRIALFYFQTIFIVSAAAD
ncbi:hypothetical protein, partial [Photobacterium damselae]|uniref:hypothetical protein n=1 Tax=Photobacterium damselae TaxID=38293 RepID=UPI0035A9A7BC